LFLLNQNLIVDYFRKSFLLLLFYFQAVQQNRNRLENEIILLTLSDNVESTDLNLLLLKMAT